ncbi:hypothetical protein PI124_g8756 [Phytophthora idaei]|nr:hypothetical protein PI124_g8756 [Phytophthora idaei]
MFPHAPVAQWQSRRLWLQAAGSSPAGGNSFVRRRCAGVSSGTTGFRETN